MTNYSERSTKFNEPKKCCSSVRNAILLAVVGFLFGLVVGVVWLAGVGWLGACGFLATLRTAE